MTTQYDQMDLGKISGISEKEAADRLKSEGYNELPHTKKRNILSMIFEIVREPMFLLLVVCGAIYFVLGDIHEACLLLSFVFVVIGITFYQERKTERALEALRDLSSPRALVIRDGQLKRIAGRDVVRGDIVSLKEGDRIPADALLISSLNLSVDESLLTGESAPVRKIPRQMEKNMERPGGDDMPFVFSGTLIVQGQGLAEVMATGVHAEIGKIGKALQTIETEKTLLQIETGRLVRNLALVGLFFCILLVFFYYYTRGSFIDGLLAGITLAMATIPEEFPMVLTIFLALGAWRISKKQVLTRRVPAVETLGSASVLCADKTGTITLNRMSIARIFAEGKNAEPEEAGIMSRPPRDPEKTMFGLRMIGLSLLQGFSVLTIVFAVFYISMVRGQNEFETRAMTFSTLIIANLGLIFTNRSWSRTIISSLRMPNAALWWVAGGTLVLFSLLLYVPFLRDLFRLSILHPIDLAICFTGGLISILWFEGLKVFNKKLEKPFYQ